MKKMMKYTLRAILAIVAMTAFCVLVGEPTDELSMSEAILYKLLSLGTLVGAFKVYLLTLSERERRELEDERA
jgi:hypothetical protein